MKKHVYSVLSLLYCLSLYSSEPKNKLETQIKHATSEVEHKCNKDMLEWHIAPHTMWQCVSARVTLVQLFWKQHKLNKK